MGAWWDCVLRVGGCWDSGWALWGALCYCGVSGLCELLLVDTLSEGRVELAPI